MMANCSCAANTLYNSQLEIESQKVTDSSFGGYNCSFVEEPDQGLICLVCARVLREPELTDCCGNHYCQTCLKKWLESSGGSCPLCREREFATLRDKKVERAVHGLHVKCKHRLSGCSWRGELRDLPSHLERDCDYILVECSNHCGSLLQRVELASHLEEQCCLRIISCDYCLLEGQYEFIVNTHHNTCLKVPLRCPNNCTDDPILRGELADHIEECPMEVVLCPVVGCGFVVPRKDMIAHTEKEVWAHFLLSQDNLLRMEGVLKETKDYANELAQSVKTLQGEIEVLKSGVRSLQTHQVYQARRQSNERMTALRRRTSDPVSSSNTQLDTTTRTSVSFLPQSSSMQVQSMASGSNSRSVMELHLIVQAQNSKNDPFLPVVLKMERFDHLKQTGVLWQSNPFYTAPFGYKLCLCVYANGCNRGEGTHLSVYVHLMAGEFDDDLSWPINEVVTVELQNQLTPRPRKTIDCYLDRTKPLSVRKRVQGDPAANTRAQRGSGMSLFISHCLLGLDTERRCQYLKNDCLYFTVF